MAKKYLRALSWTPSSTSRPKTKGQRSSTLPARFNPYISCLNDQIRSLKSSLQCRSETDPLALLSKLQEMHDCLDTFLVQPGSKSSIRPHSPSTYHLLDDFLLLTDSFSTLLLNAIFLKDVYSAARSAVRRGAESELRACVRYRKTVQKEIRKISGNVRRAGRWRVLRMEGDEAVAVVRDVVEATALVTAAVVNEVARMWKEMAVGSGSGSCVMGWGAGRKGAFGKMEMEEETMVKLERKAEVAAEVERRSEGLYRSLINTRLFLLNASSP